MKTRLFLSLLCFLIALPALGELTDADLDKIRLIVNESVKKESTASEARLKEYIDLKNKNLKEYIDLKNENLNNQIKANTSEIAALRNQMNVFIGIPLVVITLLFAWRALRDRANDKQIEKLIAENEELKRQQTLTT